jgi:spore coat protein A
MKRREFFRLSAMAAAAAVVPWRRAYAAYAQSPALLKFGPDQPLRLFGPDIPIAAPDTSTYPGVDYYNIVMGSYTDRLHPSLADTTLYGYADAGTRNFKHLGGAIVATKGTPARVSWHNELPPTHILPADRSLIAPWMEGYDTTYWFNRATPHLHGGLVPWPSDGGPFHWLSPGGVTGPSVISWLPADLQGNTNGDYWYPNTQSARMMWYHDHAVGITRLNAYAGLATGYLLKEPSIETPLMNSLGVAPERHAPIPLVIQDKIFTPDGSLWYPSTYDEEFFDRDRDHESTEELPSLVPEFWGDTMLVNGTAYPTLRVYPRKYRFQVLNACNTRFMNLQLWYAAGQRFPLSTEPDYTKPGPVFLQLGTEGGFLDGTTVPKGVAISTIAGAAGMLLAPAERADVVIDFSAVKPGRCVILHNDAPVPYPGGMPVADVWPGNRKLALPPDPGYGPNSRTLLQFYVADPAESSQGVSNDAPADPLWALPPSLPPSSVGATTRDLALYETSDEYGRLAQNLGPLSGPLGSMDAATEIIAPGTVEIWRLFNTTADTHPIHFHYFNVRILSRQRFNRRFRLVGLPAAPDPNEQGWKDTVRVNPGECITLLVDVPPIPAVNVPLRDPASGATVIQPVEIPESPRTGGHEYVWHCHILEHEEHDMMRPLIVSP